MSNTEVKAFAADHENFTFYDIAMQSDKNPMPGELVLESVTSELDYESLYEEDIFPWLMNLYPGSYSVKLHPAKNEEVVPVEIKWRGNYLVVDHQIDMGRWHDRYAITSVVTTLMEHLMEHYDSEGRFIEVEDGLLWLNKSVDKDDFWECFTGG